MASNRYLDIVLDGVVSRVRDHPIAHCKLASVPSSGGSRLFIYCTLISLVTSWKFLEFPHKFSAGHEISYACICTYCAVVTCPTRGHVYIIVPTNTVRPLFRVQVLGDARKGRVSSECNV